MHVPGSRGQSNTKLISKTPETTARPGSRGSYYVRVPEWLSGFSTSTESYTDGLKRLFDQGLSCYLITVMTAGNICFRSVYEGVLTPKGLQLARQAEVQKRPNI